MRHTVVVVDDHTLLSQAIAGLVSSFENFEVLYTCKNGKEFITRLKDPKMIPDIVLLDINMPIMNGLETTEYLAQHFSQVKVLALSVEEDDTTIRKMIQLGAKGYLLKDTQKEILQSALNQVIHTGFYYSQKVTHLLMDSLHHKETPLQCLKKRELEFIRKACSDKTYKEIADEMCLSPKTIEGYRDAIFDKLQIRNRIGLVLYAIKNKLYTLE